MIFRFFKIFDFSIFQTKFSPRKKYILCSDFFCWKAMGISFPTHLTRASGSQFHKLPSVLKKNTTDSDFFLEASSYLNRFSGYNVFRNSWNAFSPPQSRFWLVLMRNHTIFYWEIIIFNYENPKISPAAPYFSVIYTHAVSEIFENFKNVIYAHRHICPCTTVGIIAQSAYSIQTLQRVTARVRTTRFGDFCEGI